jgi:circadian locomoter output cycle kaput protein
MFIEVSIHFTFSIYLWFICKVIFNWRSDDDSDDFDIDDDASQTNSSSNYSLINSVSSHSHSINEKRKSRNQNEKKRRDQFNMLIQELGGLLNHPRKIDKATVLNETLYYFRNYNGNIYSLWLRYIAKIFIYLQLNRFWFESKDKPLYNKEIGFKWKPFFLENDEFMRFMIDVSVFW